MLQDTTHPIPIHFINPTDYYVRKMFSSYVKEL